MLNNLISALTIWIIYITLYNLFMSMDNNTYNWNTYNWKTYIRCVCTYIFYRYMSRYEWFMKHHIAPLLLTIQITLGIIYGIMYGLYCYNDSKHLIFMSICNPNTDSCSHVFIMIIKIILFIICSLRCIIIGTMLTVSIPMSYLM